MPTENESSLAKLQVEYWRGIHLKDSILWMDAPRRVDLCFISHSHRCERINHGKILCTESTATLCKSRGMNANFLISPYEQTFSLGGMELELHPAGHMPGSAQLKVTYNNQFELVYTGHFDLNPHRTTEQAKIHSCDILVMDSGHAHPQVRHDPIEKSERALLKWTKNALRKNFNPIILADPTGLAQEIAALFIEQGIEVRAHKSIYSLCKVFSSMGLPTKGVKSLSKKVLRDEVLLMPPHLANSNILDCLERSCFALVTDSPKSSVHHAARIAEKTFFLGISADFLSLTEYARQSGAEEIYVVGKFANLVSERLRSMHLGAWPLKPPEQLDLFVHHGRATDMHGSQQ